MPDPQPATAIALLQPDRPANDFPLPKREYRNPSPGPLALFLSAHKLEHTARNLLPFYGPSCPVTVYDEAPKGVVGRVTLGSLASWKAPDQALLYVIG